MAPGYESAADVWQAVKDTPGLAVISGDAVPSRTSYNVSIGGAMFTLRTCTWRMKHWMAQYGCR